MSETLKDISGRQDFAISLKSLYEKGIRALEGEDGINDKTTARLDALLLLLHCAGLTRELFYAYPEQTVAKRTALRYEVLLRERKRGYCVAAITKSKWFRKHEFITTKSTLSPRGASEALVDAALEHIRNRKKRDCPVSILDMCAGTGCIGISLAKELQDEGMGFELTLCDISARALSVAKANCEKLEVEANLVKSDLFAKFKDLEYDLITANPPYVPESEFAELKAEVRMEPKSALVAKDGGMRIIKKIITQASSHMRPGACLAIEMDPRQTRVALENAERHGYGDIRIFKDLTGRDRGIIASWRD